MKTLNQIIFFPPPKSEYFLITGHKHSFIEFRPLPGRRRPSYDFDFDFWYLTPLLTILQLYHGDQF
jgi:hypothetical protein